MISKHEFSREFKLIRGENIHYPKRSKQFYLNEIGGKTQNKAIAKMLIDRPDVKTFRGWHNLERFYREN